VTPAFPPLLPALGDLHRILTPPAGLLQTGSLSWAGMHPRAAAPAPARTILVIEDEAPIASAVAARLRSEGFAIEVAADGPTGVEACSRTRPYRPRTNGKAERFIQTMLREWAYAVRYATSDQRNLALTTWIDYYNHRRPHGALATSPRSHGSPPPDQRPWELHLERSCCQQRAHNADAEAAHLALIAGDLRN
jgi:hypothetical protein